jgi:hypothetical protein
MNRNECAYAAQYFLTFLKHVGPNEAAWAMNAVLPTLMELPPGHDHVAAAQTALKESLKEFDELAQAASSEPAAAAETAPEESLTESDGLAQVASSEPADGGGEALLADGITPKPPAKKSGKAS